MLARDLEEGMKDGIVDLGHRYWLGFDFGGRGTRSALVVAEVQEDGTVVVHLDMSWRHQSKEDDHARAARAVATLRRMKEES
jgi:hypothetical protein